MSDHSQIQLFQKGSVTARAEPRVTLGMLWERFQEGKNGREWERQSPAATKVSAGGGQEVL